MYPQVFGYAATVFSFWWVVIAAWAFFRDHLDLSASIASSLNILFLMSIGAVLGVAGAIAWVIIDRQSRKENLVADKVRGLACSIGPVPLNALEPARAQELPSFESIPDVPAQFFEDWLARYRQTHPKHAALTEAMLRVYEHNKHLPATHVTGGHGGRTLLQHSLLVAYQMQILASKWSYTGLRDRTGKKVLLKLRDSAYQFDPLDPLVLIVGLAHDIGKIEAFIFENGKLVGSHHEHDLTGARMMARMPEMWDIPDEDRIAILLSIAHYHHPMELPLSPDRRAIDDRTIAVMELLIKADFVASAIERKGVVPSEQDYNEEMDAREKSDVSDEDLWIAFSEILNETGRINSADLNYNVGTICQIAGQNAMRLVLHEPSIRGALMRRLGVMQSEQLGDGRHQLTIRLLKLIDDHGLLIKSIKELSYPAESALWSLSFFGRKKTRGTNVAARLTGWPAAIVMLPTISPFVANLPSYPWTAQVERGTMGEARAKGAAEDQPKPEEKMGQSQALPVSDSQQEQHTGSTAGEGEDGADVTEEPPLQPTPAQAPLGEPELQVEKQDPPQPLHAEHEAQIHADSSDDGRLDARRDHRAGTRGRHKKPKALDLSALDKAKALMQVQDPADPPALTDPPESMSEAQLSQDAAKPIELAEKPPEEPPGLVLEGPALNQFIVPAAKQHAEPSTPSISPYLLKKSVAKVIQSEAMTLTETGGGRKIYLVSKLHLVKHVPELDWSRASSDIMALCKSSRGSGFETIESAGDLYILVDALMIKEFMER